MIAVNDLVKEYTVPAPADETGGAWLAVRRFLSPRQIKKQALHRVSFTVPKGQFLGLIGPNGAGKTTTVKVLTGILTPTSGQVEVMGFSPQRQRYEYTPHIGLVFGQRSLLWYDIPVIESLRLYADIYEVGREAFDRRLDRFAEMLAITDLLTIPVRKLSLGQRMRAEIAASLLHDPEVLFLDEPTIGLDAVAKERVRDFLRQMNQEQGTTVLLTTHDMTDIEALCQRVLIMDKGHIIYDGSVDYLKRLADQKVIEVEFSSVPVGGLGVSSSGTAGNGAVSSGAAAVARTVAALTGLTAPIGIETRPGNRLRLRVAHSDATRVVSALMDHGGVVDLNVQPPSLDSVIRRIYEGQDPLPGGADPRDAAGAAQEAWGTRGDTR